MKKFEIAETIMRQVWAESEEEAMAMFWSEWDLYYSKKHNLSIFDYDKFPIEPKYWKDAKKEGKVFLIEREVPKGNPFSDLKCTRVLEDEGERDLETIKMIEEVLKQKLPMRIEKDGDRTVKVWDWKWDYQMGKYVIQACVLGNNFYDYGEPAKPLSIDDPELKELIQKYSEYFYIEECCDCCNCCGW